MIGSVIAAIYPYDQTLAWYLLLPTIIMSLAYIWKFYVTSVKKEDEGINSSETNLKGNFKKATVSSSKFFEV